MNNETNTWRKVKRLFPNLDSLTQKQIDYELNNVKQEVKEQILNLECLKEEEQDWEKIGYEEACSAESKNELRKEIKEEIKKL